MNAANHDRTNPLTARLDRRTVLRGAAAAAATAAIVRGGRRSASAADTVEIEFLHIWGTPPGQPEATKKHPALQVIEAFNAKNTGVTVNGQTPSGDYYEVLQKAQAQIAAGDPPALVATPWASINYAVQGLGIVPLEDVGGSELSQVLANYKPEVLPLVQLNGKTVGLPFAFSCPVIYYNNDIMKSAEVDPAALFQDWPSFAASGGKIKDTTGNPIIAVGTNPDWPAQSIIQSNGGRVLDDNGQPVMDSPETVAAMQMMQDLGKAGLYLNTTTAEARAGFVGGSLACFMSSIASLGGLRNDVAFDLQTTPFPVFPGKPRKMSSGGSFIGCYAASDEQRQAAWQFLKFVASQEGTDIWMQTGYLNATTFEEQVLPGQEAAYTQLQEGLTRETPWPGARGAEIQKVWGDYVARIWSNDIGAEEGCKQAKAEIAPLLPTS
jgi:multiple sugar transport system substrate-binding protein